MKELNKNILFLILILSFSLVSGCMNLESGCSNIQIGSQYICIKSEYTVKLKFIDSNRYELIYQDSKDNVLKHQGTWESINDGFCKVKFDDWLNFNEKGLNIDNLAFSYLIIQGNNLNVGFDGTSDTSFILMEN